MFHFQHWLPGGLTTQNLILLGVALHLLAALSKAIFKAPKQRAQIDDIESKVDIVISQVGELIIAPKPTPITPTEIIPTPVVPAASPPLTISAGGAS